MPSVHTLEIDGEIIKQSHDKQEIVEEGSRIAQNAFLRPPIKVGSLTIIGLNRGGHLSWELVAEGGNPVVLAVGKIASPADIPTIENL